MPLFDNIFMTYSLLDSHYLFVKKIYLTKATNELKKLQYANKILILIISYSYLRQRVILLKAVPASSEAL